MFLFFRRFLPSTPELAGEAGVRLSRQRENGVVGRRRRCSLLNGWSGPAVVDERRDNERYSNECGVEGVVGDDGINDRSENELADEVSDCDV